MALRTLKSFSEAAAAFIALAGSICALTAALLESRLAALAALAGGLLSLRYVQTVSGLPAGFAECFGENWADQLAERASPAQQQAMLKRAWQWRIAPPLNQARWDRDLVFHVIQSEHGQTAQPLRCDLWRPPQNIPPTGIALIYVHGGGYFTSSKDFGTRSFFRHLAGQGHLIMDIDYRLAPQADLFGMLSDVLHAVAWMKANAEQLGANPLRIVLAGGSAGAHLALLAAYANGHPRLVPPDLRGSDLSVCGVISYYGIVDLTAAYRSMETFFANAPRAGEISGRLVNRLLAGRAAAIAAWFRGVDPSTMRQYLRDNHALLSLGLKSAWEQLLGGTPDEIPEVYELVSPVTHAGPACPPTLFFQGAHDYLLPLKPARKLHLKLRQAGVKSIYVELPQTEHTFDLFLPDYSPPAQAALYCVDRFLGLLTPHR